MTTEDRPRLDLDHNSKSFSGSHATRVESWREAREKCPVAWSGDHGGFWMLSDHESVMLASRDNETYSHLFDPDADDGITYIGTMGIPRVGFQAKLGLGEVGGRYHQDLRRVLNPKFSPPAVKNFEPFIQQVARWFLDQHLGSGSIDLADDIITPVTSIVTLHMLGLPTSRWRDTSDVFHSALGFAPDSPEFARAVNEQSPALLADFLEVAKRRRAEPRDDIVTAIATATPEGRLLDDKELTAVLWNIVGGGVDTTVALTSYALLHLQTDRRLRAELLAEPTLPAAAIEEFLRLYPAVQCLSRTVTNDHVAQGQQLSRGEPVVISIAAANRDPSEFADPDAVLLDRPRNRHLSFGGGRHNCIGAHVGRLVVRVLLTEILRSIPDYDIDTSSVREYEGSSMVIGVWKLPATFAPRPTLNIPKPFDG